MKFYRIFHQYDKKHIGSFPQIQDGITPTTVHDARYISNFMHKPVPDDVLAPAVILHKKAVFTDLISASFLGLEGNLIASLKFAGILQQADQFGIQYINTKLSSPTAKIEEDVAIIHPYKYGYEFIDLEKSKFGVGKNGDEIIHFSLDFEIDERLKGDDIRVVKDFNGFKPLRIMSLSFFENIEVDFFSLRNLKIGGIGFFVSEQLKIKLEKHGCTGIIFTDVNQVFP